MGSGKLLAHLYKSKMATRRRPFNLLILCTRDGSRTRTAFWTTGF